MGMCLADLKKSFHVTEDEGKSGKRRGQQRRQARTFCAGLSKS